MNDEHQFLASNRETVFYVEAAFDAGETSLGSAVLVEVQETTTRKKQKVLLTCAHVISDIRSNDSSVTLYASSNIRCWKHGATYSARDKSNSFRAKISDIRPLPQQVDEFKAGDDWVFLEVEGEEFQRTTPAAALVNESDPIPAQGLAIIGYPDGHAAFKADEGELPKVRNKPIPDLSRVDDANSYEFGVVTQDIKPGMSGGGCFSAEGVLFGIHREGNDNIIERREIRVDKISADLKESTNYRIVTPSAAYRPTKGISFAEILDPLTDGDYVVNLKGDVVVGREIVIEAGASLSILGSGKIELSPDGKFTSRGRLHIEADAKQTLSISANQSRQETGIVLQGEGCETSHFERVLFEQLGGRAIKRSSFLTSQSDEKYVAPQSELSAGGEKSGGALCLLDVTDIKFVECEFRNNESVRGGALLIENSRDVVFDQCLFSNNCVGGNSKHHGPGGAIFMQASHGVRFSKCKFAANRARDKYGCGGAVYVGIACKHVEWRECKFRHNHARYAGGGVYAMGKSASSQGGTTWKMPLELRFVDSDFTGNDAKHSLGASLHFDEGVNSVFWDSSVSGKPSVHLALMGKEDNESKAELQSAGLELPTEQCFASNEFATIQGKFTYSRRVSLLDRIRSVLLMPIVRNILLSALVLALGLPIGLENGWLGTPGQRGLGSRFQSLWSMNNLHVVRRSLNAEQRFENTAPHFVKSYQTVTIAGDIVLDNLEVEEGGHLKIEDGTKLQFRANCGIRSQGRITADGKEQRIVFDAMNVDQGWAAVYLKGDGTQQTEFTNCDFKNGRGIRVDQKVAASTLTPNEDGTLEWPRRPPDPDGKPVGGAMYINEAHDIDLTGCDFTRNTSEYGGALYIYRSSEIEVRDCKFFDNCAFPRHNKQAPGGACFVSNSHDVVFRETEFVKNRALGRWCCGGAVFVGFLGQCQFDRCTFKNNVASYVGGAIYFSSVPVSNGSTSTADTELDLKVAQSKMTQCSFQNNRGLGFLGGKPNVWHRRGDELAVDDGADVRDSGSEFQNTSSQAPMIQVGGKEKNPASLEVQATILKGVTDEAIQLSAFDDSDREFGDYEVRRIDPEHALGICGLNDALLPESQLVGESEKRYFRDRMPDTEVDTIVIHHISAINWDDPSIDPFIRREAESLVKHVEAPDALAFSPECCRAILESFGFSSHFMISRDGSILRIVPQDKVAFHAGKSKMPSGRTDVNEFSIGIELIAVHPDSYNKLEGGEFSERYTNEQYQSLAELLQYLQGEFEIKSIVGHEEVAGRAVRPDAPKTDPGPDFEWPRVRNIDLSPRNDVIFRAAPHGELKSR